MVRKLIRSSPFWSVVVFLGLIGVPAYVVTHWPETRPVVGQGGGGSSLSYPEMPTVEDALARVQNLPVLTCGNCGIFLAGVCWYFDAGDPAGPQVPSNVPNQGCTSGRCGTSGPSPIPPVDAGGGPPRWRTSVCGACATSTGCQSRDDHRGQLARRQSNAELHSRRLGPSVRMGFAHSATPPLSGHDGTEQLRSRRLQRI
jgi:hypothetical protein